MIWLIMPKIAFWMVVVGVASLTVPNPAWPVWVARTLIGSGISLFVVSLVVGVGKARKIPDTSRNSDNSNNSNNSDKDSKDAD